MQLHFRTCIATASRSRLPRLSSGGGCHSDADVQGAEHADAPRPPEPDEDFSIFNGGMDMRCGKAYEEVESGVRLHAGIFLSPR